MESWAPLGPAGKGTLSRGAGPGASCALPCWGFRGHLCSLGLGEAVFCVYGAFPAGRLTALLRPHPPALRREELEKVGGQDPQPLLSSLPSSLYQQNLQTSGLKQMTSLWFPALTTLQVHRLLGRGKSLVPGVFPSTCRSSPPHHPASPDPGPDSSTTRRDGLVHTNTRKQLQDVDPIMASRRNQGTERKSGLSRIAQL